MAFRFAPLTSVDVDVLRVWHYDPPYDVYDGDAEPEDLPRPDDPDAKASWWAARIDDEPDLAGVVEVTERDGGTDIGLGLRPDLTGHGLR